MLETLALVHEKGPLTARHEMSETETPGFTPRFQSQRTIGTAALNPENQQVLGIPTCLGFSHALETNGARGRN